jgi:hypothetical protein
MTENSTKSRSRKRLLVAIVLGSLVALTAWITNFLYSFDLNDYRQEIEEELSTQLSLPVKIAAMRYKFQDVNLALHISGLQIGNSATSVQVDAADVILNLQWTGLLQRDLRFNKISMSEPEILFRPSINEHTAAEEPHAEPAAILIDPTLLQKARVDSLEIRDGRVRVFLPSGRPKQELAITGLGAEMSNISMGSLSRLAITGELNLPGQLASSPFQLSGECSLLPNSSEGFVPHFNLDLGVQSLDTRSVAELAGDRLGDYSIAGKSSVKLHLEGSQTTGFDFRAELSARDLAMDLGPSHTSPVHLKKLMAAGHLLTRGDHPGISGLSLQVDESRLTGNLTWAPHNQPLAATFALGDCSIKISRIKQWLPDVSAPWNLIKQRLQEQGSVRINQAELSLYQDSRAQKRWRLNQIKGELQNISWEVNDAHILEITSLPFDLNGSQWQISKSYGALGTLQMSVTGEGAYRQEAIEFNALDFTCNFSPDKLLEEWHAPVKSLVTSGQIRLKGHAEGPGNKLSLDLQADLSQFGVSHSSGLQFTPGPEDRLALHGTVSPETINLDHGALKWSVAKGHVSGTMLRNQPDSLSVDALLTIDDLNRLAETLPVLERLQLRGQADLSISQRGLPSDNPPDMTLTLRDAGLHATRFIADLNQINGRVKLSMTGFSAENLRVHIGQSPVTVQAQLDDFSNPRLVIDARAPSIIASDLVFRSDKVVLRDIDGHLVFDRDRLVFAPVIVHLDGGTEAAVRGTVAFHPPFDVRLDITSEFARIAEVISLWSGSPERLQEKPVEQAPSEQKPRSAVTINARVAQGDLYGMQFHDATATIIPTRKRLSIHPLDFSVGEGFCNAQVLVDFSPGLPALLRISGHAEDVDALEVYRELLNQKNIVRGKLRGDFYLTGDIGANYLPSSHGNFSIQIHDGVLHQFQFLSKVFSLLNVSQIFALQLPDMDQEGMPFDSLSANMQLDNGILRSKDLSIRSEAMNQSYVGELNLVNKEIDLEMAIHPLGTVDKVVSHIPIAGWLLTGEDRALLTAHFSIKGKADDVSVTAMPLDTLSEPTIGLLKRTLGLPFKLFKDPQILWGGESATQ